MASSWRVQAGAVVRYRNASNRVFHAIVTNVDSQDQVDLRVGNGTTKLTVLNVVRDTNRVGAGWYRQAGVLT